MKHWEKIAGVLLLLVLFLFTCRWSPILGSDKETSSKSNNTYVDGILFPSCRIVQGVVFAQITSVEDDGYHLTEFGDPYAMDGDWHYVLLFALAPADLEVGSVVKVEVSRTTPGKVENILRFVQGGFTKEDIPLDRVGVFSERDCYVSPNFEPAKRSEPSEPEAEVAEEPKVEKKEGCWAPISPCPIDFVGECAFFVPIRRTPLGNIYWWEDRTGVPCFD
jgi:hypothetical protein